MTSKDIFERFIIIRNLYKEGSLDEPIFYKMTVQFAVEYYEAGSMDEAVGLLSSIPSEYFVDDLPGQLESDLEFTDKVHSLCVALIESNKVSFRGTDSDSLLYSLAVSMGNIGKA